MLWWCAIFSVLAEILSFYVINKVYVLGLIFFVFCFFKLLFRIYELFPLFWWCTCIYFIHCSFEYWTFISWYYYYYFIFFIMILPVYKFFLHLKKALQWGTLILLSNQILYLNCCEIIQACGWWFFMGFVATPSPKYCILNELRNTVSIQYMCWHTNNMKVKSLRACENLTIHEIWPPQLSLIQQ